MLPLRSAPSACIAAALAASALCCAPQICAQAHPPQPVTTSVTVTGSSMPVATDSVSLTILSRPQIESSGALNAATLLEQSAFINAQQQGGELGFTTITMRGGKPNLVLILVDGIPVNDLSSQLGGAFDLSSLALDNVDRIEIARGPLSSVYGSEAVSGVVNFITRKSAPAPSFKLDTSFGSFGQAHGSLTAGAPLGHRFSYSAGASTFRIGQQTGNDAASLHTGDAALNLPLDSRRAANLLARYSQRHANQFPVGSGGPLYAINRQPETDRSGDLVLGAAWQHQYNKWWLYRLDSDAFRQTAFDNVPAILDAVPPGRRTQPPMTDHTRFTRFQFRGSSVLTPASHFTARLAAGLRHESGVQNGEIAHFLPDRFTLIRNTAETAAELAFTSARFTATAATGTSTTDGYGTTPSPRLGASFQLAPRTTLKATWGQAFSLPSFYSYAEPLIGNKHLRPERLTAWDACLEQKLGSHASASATWFNDRYTDLINFSAAAFKLVNVPGVRTSGIEASGRFTAAKFEIAAAGSYLYWKIDGSNEPLRNQPHGRGSFSVNWHPWATLALGGDLTAVGAAYDYEVPVPQIDRTHPRSVTGLHAQWTLRRNLELHTRVDNLFNQQFQQFVGFPDPGIRARAGLSWSLPSPHSR